jgi:phage-related protein
VATFNAGSIEANLTLGRSAWTRDLRKTQKEIADLERKSINVSLDLDSDNFQVQLDNAELMIKDFDDNTYSPSVDLVTREFDEKMAELEARLDRLAARSVTVEVDADVDNAIIQLGLVEQEMDLLEADDVMVRADADVDNAIVQLGLVEQEMDLLESDPVLIRVHQRGIGPATAKLAALRAEMELVDDKDIDIDVDYNSDKLEELVGSSSGGGGGYLGLFRILLYAIIALSPVLSVAISTLSAAVVGFTAAVVGAAGPLAVLGAGLFGLIKRYKDAQEAGETMTGPMGELQDALETLSDAWDTFLDNIEVAGFSVMAEAIGLVAEILPALAPIFNETAEMISGVLESIQEWMDSPEFNRMIEFFQGFGIRMLETFLRIGGNLLRFFGLLFEAIAPFAEEMMGGLEDMTAGWAKWAEDLENNKAFQDWVDRAIEYGPQILEMLGSLWAALMNIGEALEPFAGPMLDALIWFFDLIANADPTVLTIIIGALVGLWVVMNVLVPIITTLTTIIPILGSVIGFLLSPIGLVILAIAALVGILIYMWFKNEEFREAVIATWEAIRDTLGPIIEEIVALIRDNWGPIKDFVGDIWADIQSIITNAMVSIRQIIRGAMAVIEFIWSNFGDKIIQYVKGAFTIVSSIIRGWFQFAKGIFQVIRGVLTGDWRMIWQGIQNIFRGIMTAITGIARGFWQGFSALWGIALRALRMVWNTIWGDIKSTFSESIGWIRGKVGELVGIFQGLPGKISNAVSGAFNGIKTAFGGAINSVINWWNGLSFSIPGIDPPGPGPKFGGFTVSTPNIGTYAMGGYFTEPTLGWVGEGNDNEVLAPEPVLERIVRDNSRGGGVDYAALAGAIATALAPLIMRIGISREDLDEILSSAAPQIDIDARSDHEAAGRLASAIGFELRLLGYGGKYA